MLDVCTDNIPCAGQARHDALSAILLSQADACAEVDAPSLSEMCAVACRRDGMGDTGCQTCPCNAGTAGTFKMLCH